MDDMKKRSFDHSTNKAIIEWSPFVIHLDLNTNEALYYRGEPKAEDLNTPDFCLTFDSQKIKLAHKALGINNNSEDVANKQKALILESSDNEKAHYYMNTSGGEGNEYIKVEEGYVFSNKIFPAKGTYIHLLTNGEAFIVHIHRAFNGLNYYEIDRPTYNGALDLAYQRIFNL